MNNFERRRPDGMTEPLIIEEGVQRGPTRVILVNTPRRLSTSPSSSGCCGSCLCLFVIVFVLLPLIIYTCLLLTSPCWKGCQGICPDGLMDCNRICLNSCWKGHFAKCPRDGDAVCLFTGAKAVNDVGHAALPFLTALI